jgi:hypothetical protein
MVEYATECSKNRYGINDIVSHELFDPLDRRPNDKNAGSNRTIL